MSSRQLWSPAEDLHRIEPVNMLALGVLTSPLLLTEEPLTDNGFWGKKSQFSLVVCPGRLASSNVWIAHIRVNNVWGILQET